MSREDTLIGSKIDSENSWKRRTSDISGYQRAFYMTNEKDDYIRVDYNLKENRVRLYVEAAKDGNKPYFSVIQNGKITAERNVFTGRQGGVNEAISERAADFASLPNNDVLKLINNHYGIKPHANKNKKQQISNEQRQALEATRQRYFVGQIEAGRERGRAGFWGVLLGKFKESLLGILLGAGISVAAYYIFYLNFSAAGIAAACYGVLSGFVDIFIRRKEADAFRMIFFIAIGIVLYIYGYYLA